MRTATAPKPLHIFKPGRWTTVAGESIEFGEADLQATAQAYDPKISKAPLVVGHPKTDAPAQGWAASLAVSGRGLYAAADKVDPEFAEEVRAGRWERSPPSSTVQRMPTTLCQVFGICATSAFWVRSLPP